MAGKSSEEAKQYAIGDFRQILGRDPTEDELALAIPQYQGEWNGGETGRAYVAQLAQNEKNLQNTPAKQHAKEQEEYRKNAPQYYDKIDSLFNNYLGRASTQEEKDHFGALLASGTVDPYQVGTFLQALPESVRKQDKEFQQSISSDLQNQDQRYFNEQILPSIQSQYAKQGRDINSSGFATALAQAATQQNRQRESFLSNLSAQQYAGSQANARADYESTLARQYGLQDYSRQRADQIADAGRQRMYDLQNFQMQKQAYDEYLSRYGKRSSPWGAIGGLVGGAGGALLGGLMTKTPQGAQAGYGIGSGVGGGLGGLF